MSRYYAALASSLVVMSQAVIPSYAQNTGDNADGVALEEIIVTAERRPQDVQHTAIAISVLSGDSLTNAGVTQPSDLTNMVPGVHIASVASTPQVYIRGVGSTVQNAYTDPAIAFSVDGVFNGEPWGANGEFFDLQRVEVLKGPQGTLQGRNSTSGAFNIITNKPKLDVLEGNAGLQVGNYRDIETNAAINLPVGTSSALRAALQTVNHDGYYTAGYDDAKSVSARLQYLLQPSDDFSLLVSGSYHHEGGRGSGDVPIEANGQYANPNAPWQSPPEGDPLVTGDQARCIGTSLYAAFPFCYQRDGKVNIDNWRIHAQLDWNLGFGTLTVIPAYWRVHADIFAHPRMATNHIDTDSRQSTLEARLSSNNTTASKLTWLVGVFYLNNDANVPQSFFQFNNYPHPPYTVNNILNPLDLSDETAAVFTQESLAITQALRLTAGLRYTREKKTKDGVQITNATAAQCAVPLTSYDAVSGRCTISEIGSDSWNSVLWRAGLEYDVTASSMLYANVSTGQHAGGFFQGLPPNTYKPEWLTAYALGSKNRFLENRVQANFEAYYWNYKDLQVTNTAPLNPPTIFGSVTLNAGKAIIYGVDADFEFLLSRNDVLSTSLAYMHTENKTFVFPILGPVPSGACRTGPSAGTEDCSGTELLHSPQWSGNVRYEHSFNLSNDASIKAAAEVHAESRAWLGFDETEQQRRPSYHKSNIDLGYHAPNDSWSLTAYVNNIENEDVRTTLQLSGITRTAWVFLMPPRTYGMRGALKF